MRATTVDVLFGECVRARLRTLVFAPAEGDMSLLIIEYPFIFEPG